MGFFLNLLVTALMPVLKVLMVTGIGLFVALERINLLGPTARQHLNTLVFYVFYPALVAGNLADTVTPSSLAAMWFMPVNILLTFIIGSALGWILIKITRTPQHLHALVLGCCSAGNMGNLFFIVIPAICEESNSPFVSSDCTRDGDTYASLSSALGAIGVWTYVYMIMRMSATKCQGEIDLCNPNSTTSITLTASQEAALETSSNCCSTELLRPSSRTGRWISWSDDQELLQPHDHDDQEKSKVAFSEKIKQKIEIFMEKTNFKQVCTPSTIGVIIGFGVGLISPIRQLTIGENAPLRVIESCATLLGDAAIPSTTLIMGANLLSGLKGSDVGIVVILGIIAVRNFFLPVMGLVVVKAATHFGLVGSDLLLQFVLMLQYAAPPAMATSVICQLFKFGQRECSVIMLWTYAVAGFTLTLWSTAFMWLVS